MNYINLNYNGYLDEYGMVSCNMVASFPAPHTENGLLFTANAMICERELYEDTEFDFDDLFNSCFIDGKLYRSPEPHPKPESHDNYCGAMLGAALINDTTIPKRLLWSLIKHFGYINGEFVGRFPQIWLLLLGFCPVLKWLVFPLNYLLFKLQNTDKALNDASALQLQLTIVSILDILYPRMDYYNKWVFKLPWCEASVYDGMRNYYGDLHPTTQNWKEIAKC